VTAVRVPGLDHRDSHQPWPELSVKMVVPEPRVGAPLLWSMHSLGQERRQVSAAGRLSLSGDGSSVLWQGDFRSGVSVAGGGTDWRF
jgi:hypothetical protein